jgi:hypothetical protein
MVVIDEKKYMTIKDFASLVNKSYQLIYKLMKYGDDTTNFKLEHIYWNNKPLILASEEKHFRNRKSVGRPRKEKTK